MKMTRRQLLLVCVAAFMAIPTTLVVIMLDTNPAVAERRERGNAARFNVERFQPRQVVNAYPPILNPPHVSAKEASEQLRPNELVLGVELEGETRAYPINMLTGPSREIFNDQLGGQAIAATW